MVDVTEERRESPFLRRLCVALSVTLGILNMFLIVNKSQEKTTTAWNTHQRNQMCISPHLKWEHIWGNDWAFLENIDWFIERWIIWGICNKKINIKQNPLKPRVHIVTSPHSLDISVPQMLFKWDLNFKAFFIWSLIVPNTITTLRGQSLSASFTIGQRRQLCSLCELHCVSLATVSLCRHLYLHFFSPVCPRGPRVSQSAHSLSSETLKGVFPECIRLVYVPIST